MAESANKNHDEPKPWKGGGKQQQGPQEEARVHGSEGAKEVKVTGVLGMSVATATLRTLGASLASSPAAVAYQLYNLFSQQLRGLHFIVTPFPMVDYSMFQCA